VQTYVERVARAQRDAGVEVTILCGSEAAGAAPPDAAGLPVEESVAGLRVFRLPRWRDVLPSGFRNPALPPVLEALHRRFDFEVVHVHHWHDVSLDLVAKARRLGIPAVVTLHDYFAVCPWFFRLRHDQRCSPAVPLHTCVECVQEQAADPAELLVAALQRRRRLLVVDLWRAGARLTLSQEQADYLGRVPVLSGLRFEALQPPDPEQPPHPELPPATCRRGPTPDATGGLRRLITWGGLVHGKGVHLLVAAAERLATPVEVHHFGQQLDTAYRDRIRAAARRTRLELHGSFARADLLRVASGYDLAVFPSLFFETHGYAVDEAMQLGLPVVVSDRGAPVTRVGGRGIGFPGGDVEALTALLQGLQDEPARLAAMRAATPPAGVGIDAHVAALARVYLSVVTNPARR
jgi:glycosyltransferase involved in cell wall biosynthesis